MLDPGGLSSPYKHINEGQLISRRGCFCKLPKAYGGLSHKDVHCLPRMVELLFHEVYFPVVSVLCITQYPNITENKCYKTLVKLYTSRSGIPVSPRDSDVFDIKLPISVHYLCTIRGRYL